MASAGAVHVRVRAIACRSSADGDRPAAALSCQAACSAGVTRAATMTVRRSTWYLPELVSEGRRNGSVMPCRGRWIYRNPSRPSASASAQTSPSPIAMRSTIAHIELRCQIPTRTQPGADEDPNTPPPTTGRPSENPGPTCPAHGHEGPEKSLSKRGGIERRQ